MGCSQQTVIHTKIPINNTVFFRDGVGIIYNKNGKVFMATIQANTTPFLKAKIPATMVFNSSNASILDKVIINGTTYRVSHVFLRTIHNGSIIWKKIR